MAETDAGRDVGRPLASALRVLALRELSRLAQHADRADATGLPENPFGTENHRRG